MNQQILTENALISLYNSLIRTNYNISKLLENSVFFSATNQFEVNLLEASGMKPIGSMPSDSGDIVEPSSTNEPKVKQPRVKGTSVKKKPVLEPKNEIPSLNPQEKELTVSVKELTKLAMQVRKDINSKLKANIQEPILFDKSLSEVVGLIGDLVLKEKEVKKFVESSLENISEKTQSLVATLNQYLTALYGLTALNLSKAKRTIMNTIEQIQGMVPLGRLRAGAKNGFEANIENDIRNPMASSSD